MARLISSQEEVCFIPPLAPGVVLPALRQSLSVMGIKSVPTSFFSELRHAHLGVDIEGKEESREFPNDTAVHFLQQGQAIDKEDRYRRGNLLAL